MLIYEALKKDHVKVKTLLNELVSLGEGDQSRRHELIETIRDELIPHSRAEESVFYNSLRAIDSAKDIIMHSFTEHIEVETLLRTLQVADKIDLAWKANAQKLKKALEHHIDEEEGKIFNVAQQLFTREEAEMNRPMQTPQIVKATPQDMPDLLRFIRALAIYEKLEDQVVATEEKLRSTLFSDRPAAEVLFVQVGDQRLGFALFFASYSTFLGQPGIYLEDLFILPEERGKGYGKFLLKHLAQIAVSRNCGRLEWSVLDWNEPALEFYRKVGAVPMNNWTVQRLDNKQLLQFAQSSSF